MTIVDRHDSSLAIWLWVILFQGNINPSFNVGSDQSININDLAHLVFNSINPSCHIRLKFQPDETGKSNRYVPSTFKAQLELGLKSTCRLEHAVQQTAMWWKQE
jgi:dTDP-D-glucose 4,6-dehydratase